MVGLEKIYSKKDHVLEFLPTAVNAPWIGYTLAGMLAAIGILAVISIILRFIFKIHFWYSEALFVLFLLFGAIFALVVMFSSIAANHNDNLEKNLLQKYDIVSVDYESKVALVDPTEMESQLIVLNLQDGKQGSFSLTQDRNNEPTLTELPESSISLEEITK